MNMQLRGIGRIALLAIAVAVLIGIAGRSASAEPIDINSGPATVARGLCVGSGGDWNITNNVFFCTYGDGHGWACDMDTNPVVCWSFLTAPTGGIKGNIGVTQIGAVQVQPTSGGPVNGAVAQAQIANAQIGSVTIGATTSVQPNGKVVKAGSTKAVNVGAP
jgi:hypothetical protein